MTSLEGGVQGRRVVRNVSNNLLGEDTPTPCHKISPGTSPTIKQVYDRLSCVRLIKNNDCSVPRCVCHHLTCRSRPSLVRANDQLRKLGNSSLRIEK